MRIAVAKEIEVGERRVALIPDVVAKLVKQGLEVWVETGAGERSFLVILPMKQQERKLLAIPLHYGAKQIFY